MKKLFLPLVLLLAGYYALFGGEYSHPDLLRIHGEQDRVEEELGDARAELLRLQARADSLEHDPEALERLARERFGLIREGELLYRFADVPDGEEEPFDEGEVGWDDPIDTAPPRR